MNDDNFHSIDRLFDFGLSTAIAQQMANSMNQSLAEMRSPGATNPTSMGFVHDYFVVLNKKASGPYSKREILSLIAQRQISRSTLTWKLGMTNWMSIADVPEILALFHLSPPPLTSI